jgi:hypothetical protein
VSVPSQDLEPDFKKEVGNHLKKDNSISYLPHIQAYGKKVKTVMVNNSTNINSNSLSHGLNFHLKYEGAK